ncbi:MAG: hypothetical protein GY862_36040 [Gammaproteobacteria bacterium]|nr:hypothetical protein [Gammaproteobacteria bacterium]
MINAGRNSIGLTDRQIQVASNAWNILCGDKQIPFDTIEASQPFSVTRFNEAQHKVFLGANAFPGNGTDANSRLSLLACLAHELAHAERFSVGYRRPLGLPDVLIDEAETSLRACFTSVLNMKDREDLVEDSRDRLIEWLAIIHEQEGKVNES